MVSVDLIVYLDLVGGYRQVNRVKLIESLDEYL